MAVKARTVLVLAGVGAGAFLAYQGIRALGLAAGLWTVAPTKSKAKPPRDFGPYPFDFQFPANPEDPWYGPAATVRRAQASNARPRLLRQEVLKAANGDIGGAMAALWEKRAQAEGAQALLEALRELAPQGSSVAASQEGEAAKAKVAPIYAVSPGGAGIVHVARTLDRLMKTPEPERTRFDRMLMEDAVRLLGFHGAPAVPEERKQATVDGKGTMPPIDPVVRGVLRAALPNADLQPFASRALGQLGDLETAKDLIENPKKYPSANISDFGPEAVELFKKKRLDLLQKGRGGGEEAFWQGVRLSYRDRETAIDLARAGDSGAGMAMQRHMAFEGYVAKDRDERMARYLDIALRFPETREAFVAQNAINTPSGDALAVIVFAPDGKKTREVLLKALDHDLSLLFAEKAYNRDDLIIGRFDYFIQALHAATNPKYEFEKDPLYKELNEQLIILFNKHRKSKSKFQYPNYIAMMSLYGSHLGYPPIEMNKKNKIQLINGIKKLPKGEYYRGFPLQECLKMGHIKSLEDW